MNPASLPAAPAVPAPAVFEAPAHWRAIEFLSDLHLGPEVPATLQALAHHLERSDADAVVILGDLFEVWIGDDVRFGAFEQACVDVLRRCSARRYTAFVAGNRDFLVGGDFLRDTGLHGWSDPTLLRAFGSSVLLTHGDALCLADVRYQQFRHLVRGDAWQRAFLALPLPARQEQARQIRQASEDGRKDQMSWDDIDVPHALAWLRAAPAARLVHGHTHHPSHDRLDADHERWVLSDWDLDATPPRADLLRWTATGIERRSPLG